MPEIETWAAAPQTPDGTPQNATSRLKPARSLENSWKMLGGNVLPKVLGEILEKGAYPPRIVTVCYRLSQIG
jgi:hypothetical protein